MFYGISQHLMHQLQLIKNASAKAITGKYKYDYMDHNLNKLHWLSVQKRVVLKICLLSYKAVNGLAPIYLKDMFNYAHTITLIVPHRATKGYGDRTFSVKGPKFFNMLPEPVKQSLTVDSFKSSLKTYLFTLSYIEVACFEIESSNFIIRLITCKGLLFYQPYSLKNF